MSDDALVNLIEIRKKMLNENLMNKLRNHNRLSYVSDDITDREIISVLPLITDDTGKKTFIKKYQQYWNKINTDDSMKKNRRQSRSDTTNWGIEFPYGEAIPFNPEKHWMLLHQHPENNKNDRQTPIESENTSENNSKSMKKRLIEFPYSKAIPFDPKKHSMLLNKLEDHHEISLLPLANLRRSITTNTDAETNLLDWNIVDNHDSTAATIKNFPHNRENAKKVISR